MRNGETICATSVQGGTNPLATLGPAALDQLMPLHIRLSPAGRILGHGPTLQKITGDGALIGQTFFDLFRIRRPVELRDFADLMRHQGQKLRIGYIPRPTIELRGLAMAEGAGGMILNLGFGIGLVEALGRHALTEADFAPTDLAIEMIYLVEAQRSVMEELRRLNNRLQGAKVQAEEQAMTDTLTGLRNRRAFDLALETACAGNVPFAVMHLDLDLFKAVNDTHGHAAGDHVLRHVARVLREETRAGDTIARIGGDEFVILFPGLAKPQTLLQVASRIIQRMRRPIPYAGVVLRVGASVGLTVSTSYAPPVAAVILNDADQALYDAKRAGRSRAALWSPSDPKVGGGRGDP